MIRSEGIASSIIWHRVLGSMIGLFCFLIDRLSKDAVNYYNIRWNWYHLGVFAQENTIGSFSLPIEATLAKYFAFFVLILIVLLYFIVKREISKIGIILIFVGGLSNFLDRFLVGGVIDIFHLSHNSWNIADICVVLGIIIVFTELTNKKRANVF